MNMNKDYNKAIPLKYIPTDAEKKENRIKNDKDWPYTFDIPKAKLKEIGELVELSRPSIPTTFSSKWENPIVQSGGNRGVDWIDFLLYMLLAYTLPLGCLPK